MTTTKSSTLLTLKSLTVTNPKSKINMAIREPFGTSEGLNSLNVGTASGYANATEHGDGNFHKTKPGSIRRAPLQLLEVLTLQ